MNMMNTNGIMNIQKYINSRINQRCRIININSINGHNYYKNTITVCYLKIL